MGRSNRWNDSMSVGVAEMDGDHRVLLGLINELHDAGEDADSFDSVSQYLDILARYAAFHLAREEAMLEAVGYPHLIEHKARHDELRRQTDDLLRRFQDLGDPEVFEELEAFLMDWWTRHIMVEDMAYRPFVEGRPEAGEAARAPNAIDPDYQVADRAFRR